MSKKKPTTKYFSRAEAESKIGKRVRMLVELLGAPHGTEGTVVSANEAVLGKAFYHLAIQWDVLTQAFPRQNQVLVAISGGYGSTQSYKPLVQWFDKEEYEHFLVEIETTT